MSFSAFWIIRPFEISAFRIRPFENSALWFSAFRSKIIFMSINVWSTVSSQNFHRLCVWLMYKFWYVNMPNVTAGYGRFSDSIAFLGIFIHYFDHSYLNCCVSKLLLIVYVINTHILIYQYARCDCKLWYVILYQPFINFVESLWK